MSRNLPLDFPSGKISSATTDRPEHHLHDCRVHSHSLFFLQPRDQQKVIPGGNKFLCLVGTALICFEIKELVTPRLWMQFLKRNLPISGLA